jgi:UDP-N-acetylmuramate--alanine ligase
MIVPVPDEITTAADWRRVHFVGIGGAGLSAIARVMVSRGVAVSGSDAMDSATLQALADEGIDVHVGHLPEHVSGADLVVVSTAVRADNPEVVEAARLGIPIWPRAAALQSLMVGRRAIVVTGTHGKTTTTAMLVGALLAAGLDPSYTVGSTLIATGRNAAAGSDDLFIAEGDESDAAILAYTPHAAVVTNVDVDHLDFFGTAEAYAAVFDDFLDRLDPQGFVVCGIDDPGGRRLADTARRRGLRTVTVATSAGADVWVRAGAPGDDGAAGSSPAGGVAPGGGVVVRHGVDQGHLALATPGRAYALDAAAALAVGLELGLPFDALAHGLAGYAGTGRRMEPKGSRAGVRVVDSYAHHPSEIVGDIAAGRVLAGDGRLVVCFQPHLYSRTLAFAVDMGRALGGADEIVVLDVYPAREEPLAGVSGALVVAAVPPPSRRVHDAPTLDAALATLDEIVRPGDLVLTLGAGDITVLGPRLLDLLAAREEEPS